MPYVDSPTFFLVMYNFAIVGIVAIFYQRGIPVVITQGYLVCISVIMAWNIAKLPGNNGKVK